MSGKVKHAPRGVAVDAARSAGPRAEARVAQAPPHRHHGLAHTLCRLEENPLWRKEGQPALSVPVAAGVCALLFAFTLACCIVRPTLLLSSPLFPACLLLVILLPTVAAGLGAAGVACDRRAWVWDHLRLSSLSAEEILAARFARALPPPAMLLAAGAAALAFAGLLRPGDALDLCVWQAPSAMGLLAAALLAVPTAVLSIANGCLGGIWMAGRARRLATAVPAACGVFLLLQGLQVFAGLIWSLVLNSHVHESEWSLASRAHHYAQDGSSILRALWALPLLMSIFAFPRLLDACLEGIRQGQE